MSETVQKAKYRPGSWIALPIAIVLGFVIFLAYAAITEIGREPGITQAELDANRAKTAVPAP